MATPRAKRRAISAAADVTQNWPRENSVSATSTSTYSVLRPNLSVNSPPTKPPKNMPTSDAAATRPSSSTDSCSDWLSCTRTTPMMLRI
ncbi:hypothetical protein D3C77_736780 [compost metagenome]